MHIIWLLIALLLPNPVQAAVYLCPTDGDGSDSNAYRSRALSELLPGRGNVELRTDVSKAGLMLCESDVLPKDLAGVTILGNDRISTLSERTKAAVRTATGKEFQAETVEQAIKELVIPTLPVKVDGEHTIILNPSREPVKERATLRSAIHYHGVTAVAAALGQSMMASIRASLAPSVAWANRYATETFNCANSGSLTCVYAWTDKTATTIDIVSNQASGTGTTVNEVYADTPTATLDYEVSATVSATLIGGTEVACSVIGRTTADATRTFYRVVPDLLSTGELNSVRLSRTVSGSHTSLAVDTTDFSNGDRFDLKMIGTTISAKKNGVEVLSVTDANITTGTYGGLRNFGDHASNNCTWDDFRINDVITVRPQWSN